MAMDWDDPGGSFISVRPLLPRRRPQVSCSESFLIQKRGGPLSPLSQTVSGPVSAPAAASVIPAAAPAPSPLSFWVSGAAPTPAPLEQADAAPGVEDVGAPQLPPTPTSVASLTSFGHWRSAASAKPALMMRSLTGVSVAGNTVSMPSRPRASASTGGIGEVPMPWRKVAEERETCRAAGRALIVAGSGQSSGPTPHSVAAGPTPKLRAASAATPSASHKVTPMQGPDLPPPPWYPAAAAAPVAEPPQASPVADFAQAMVCRGGALRSLPDLSSRLQSQLAPLSPSSPQMVATAANLPWRTQPRGSRPSNLTS